MYRLESKIKPMPEVRQFKKEFDMMNINIDTVELTDGNITKLNNCHIVNTMTDSWMGDFYMSGDTGVNGDHRTLHINIPFAGYAGILPEIITVLNELENNDFDDVKEFASEVRFRLASEAAAAAKEEAKTTTKPSIEPMGKISELNSDNETAETTTTIISNSNE